MIFYAYCFFFIANLVNLRRMYQKNDAISIITYYVMHCWWSCLWQNEPSLCGRRTWMTSLRSATYTVSVSNTSWRTRASGLIIGCSAMPLSAEPVTKKKPHFKKPALHKYFLIPSWLSKPFFSEILINSQNDSRGCRQ